jgi:hypothetical protein
MIPIKSQITKLLSNTGATVVFNESLVVGVSMLSDVCQNQK